ncbi:TIGR02677 family protein [Rhodoglobus aureus]|uniref:TIGR02677 family protein n=1 Tax=Rhodoglobus aureus TaxID=191497 RepID=A0ABN1VEI2_9MICO
MAINAGDRSFSVFRHLNADNAALYRRVLGGFVAAKERFQVHLRPDDVLEAMRARDDGEQASVDMVTDALDQLVTWGNLLASPDTGRVVQVADFYRKRHLFQLSREGEAVERALRTFDDSLGRRGALQAVALDDIAATLQQVGELVGGDSAGSNREDLDLSKLQASLTALAQRFTELADNASVFMGSLQRTIDLTDTDEEVFLAYKSRLVDYLESFIRDLAVRGPQIATLVTVLDPARLDAVLRSLAERDAASAAPDPNDPGALREQERVYELWTARWAGLRGWFLTANGRDSQAKLLRMSALAAVPALLDAVRAVNARRSGRSDRATDFLTLARWFQEASDDNDRHRLARATFGLYPARHLTADSETWQRWNDDPSLIGAPWSDAVPLAISPQLRRTGSYERSGRPNQVIDRSAERAMLALRMRQQAEQIAAARRRLATEGEVELRALTGLDSTAFGLFLTLLGDALVAKRPGEQQVRTASSDGTMCIELSTLDDGEPVGLTTARGTLWGPNHLVSITDLSIAVESAPAIAQQQNAEAP